MRKYLDPKYDLTFKKVFGEHKDLVISFLNALLPLKDGQEVREVEYLQPEMLPDNPLRKNTIVDVRCKDQQGRQFLVEMQMHWIPDFKQRVLFNSSKAYVSQAVKGVDYSRLAPVYSLNIVNDKAFDGDDFFHHFQLAEKGCPDRIIEGIELVFIELPKYRPQVRGHRKMMDLWLRFLTEIDESTETVPGEMTSEPEISKALKIVEHSAYSDAQLAAYDKYQDIIATEKTLVSGSFKKGMKEGLEKGLEKGREKGLKEGKAEGLKEGKAEIAKNLKSMGMDFDTIATVTGLSKEDIEKL